MISLDRSLKKLSPSFVSVLCAVFAVSYLINLLWEVSHSVLYNWSILPLHNTVYFYVPKILGATLGDAIMLSVIFLVLAVYRTGFLWIRFTRRGDYIFLVCAGLLFAVVVELRAAHLHLWTYASSMPLVAGMGLTPLIQLAITGLATLWVLRHLYGSRG